MNSIQILFVLSYLYEYATSNTGCRNKILPDPANFCCGVEVTNIKSMVDNHAKIYQYPWLALIEYMKNDKMKILCGGSLISSKYVLTAAHCVIGPLIIIVTPTRIRLGEYDTRHDGPDCVRLEGGAEDCTDGLTRIPIKNTLAHPLYQPNDILQKHDIALIKMTQKARFTDYIRPICLPETDTAVTTDGVIFTMAGWATSYGFSPVKLREELPLVHRDDCQAAYSSLLNVTLEKGQFCAGGKKSEDSCENDSGLPLMYRTSKSQYVGVGIVSFGPTPCGLSNVPRVFTNVFEYISWIKLNLTP